MARPDRKTIIAQITELWNNDSPELTKENGYTIVFDGKEMTLAEAKKAKSAAENAGYLYKKFAVFGPTGHCATWNFLDNKDFSANMDATLAELKSHVEDMHEVGKSVTLAMDNGYPYRDMRQAAEAIMPLLEQTLADVKAIREGAPMTEAQRSGIISRFAEMQKQMDKADSRFIDPKKDLRKEFVNKSKYDSTVSLLGHTRDYLNGLEGFLVNELANTAKAAAYDVQQQKEAEDERREAERQKQLQLEREENLRLMREEEEREELRQQLLASRQATKKLFAEEVVSYAGVCSFDEDNEWYMLLHPEAKTHLDHWNEADGQGDIELEELEDEAAKPITLHGIDQDAPKAAKTKAAKTKDDEEPEDAPKPAGPTKEERQEKLKEELRAVITPDTLTEANSFIVSTAIPINNKTNPTLDEVMDYCIAHPGTEVDTYIMDRNGDFYGRTFLLNKKTNRFELYKVEIKRFDRIRMALQNIEEYLYKSKPEKEKATKEWGCDVDEQREALDESLYKGMDEDDKEALKQQNAKRLEDYYLTELKEVMDECRKVYSVDKSDMDDYQKLLVRQNEKAALDKLLEKCEGLEGLSPDPADRKYLGRRLNYLRGLAYANTKNPGDKQLESAEKRRIERPKRQQELKDAITRRNREASHVMYREMLVKYVRKAVLESGDPTHLAPGKTGEEAVAHIDYAYLTDPKNNIHVLTGFANKDYTNEKPGAHILDILVDYLFKNPNEMVVFDVLGKGVKPTRFKIELDGDRDKTLPVEKDNLLSMRTGGKLRTSNSQLVKHFKGIAQFAYSSARQVVRWGDDQLNRYEQGMTEEQWVEAKSKMPEQVLSDRYSEAFNELRDVTTEYVAAPTDRNTLRFMKAMDNVTEAIDAVLAFGATQPEADASTMQELRDLKAELLQRKTALQETDDYAKRWTQEKEEAFLQQEENQRKEQERLKRLEDERKQREQERQKKLEDEKKRYQDEQKRLKEEREKQEKARLAAIAAERAKREAALKEKRQKAREADPVWQKAANEVKATEEKSKELEKFYEDHLVPYAKYDDKMVLRGKFIYTEPHTALTFGADKDDKNGPQEDRIALQNGMAMAGMGSVGTPAPTVEAFTRRLEASRTVQDTIRAYENRRSQAIAGGLNEHDRGQNATVFYDFLTEQQAATLRNCMFGFRRSSYIVSFDKTKDVFQLREDAKNNRHQLRSAERKRNQLVSTAFGNFNRQMANGGLALLSRDLTDEELVKNYRTIVSLLDGAEHLTDLFGPKKPGEVPAVNPVAEAYNLDIAKAEVRAFRRNVAQLDPERTRALRQRLADLTDPVYIYSGKSRTELTAKELQSFKDQVTGFVEQFRVQMRNKRSFEVASLGGTLKEDWLDTDLAFAVQDAAERETLQQNRLRSALGSALAADAPLPRSADALRKLGFAVSGLDAKQPLEDALAQAAAGRRILAVTAPDGTMSFLGKGEGLRQKYFSDLAKQLESDPKLGQVAFLLEGLGGMKDHAPDRAYQQSRVLQEIDRRLTQYRKENGGAQIPAAAQLQKTVNAHLAAQQAAAKYVVPEEMSFDPENYLVNLKRMKTHLAEYSSAFYGSNQYKALQKAVDTAETNMAALEQLPLEEQLVLAQQNLAEVVKAAQAYQQHKGDTAPKNDRERTRMAAADFALRMATAMEKRAADTMTYMAKVESPLQAELDRMEDVPQPEAGKPLTAEQKQAAARRAAAVEEMTKAGKVSDLTAQDEFGHTVADRIAQGTFGELDILGERIGEGVGNPFLTDDGTADKKKQPDAKEANKAGDAEKKEPQPDAEKAKKAEEDEKKKLVPSTQKMTEVVAAELRDQVKNYLDRYYSYEVRDVVNIMVEEEGVLPGVAYNQVGHRGKLAETDAAALCDSNDFKRLTENIVHFRPDLVQKIMDERALREFESREWPTDEEKKTALKSYLMEKESLSAGEAEYRAKQLMEQREQRHNSERSHQSDIRGKGEKLYKENRAADLQEYRRLPQEIEKQEQEVKRLLDRLGIPAADAEVVDSPTVDPLLLDAERLQQTNQRLQQLTEAARAAAGDDKADPVAYQKRLAEQLQKLEQTAEYRELRGQQRDMVSAQLNRKVTEVRAAAGPAPVEQAEAFAAYKQRLAQGMKQLEDDPAYRSLKKQMDELNQELPALQAARQKLDELKHRQAELEELYPDIKHRAEVTGQLEAVEQRCKDYKATHETLYTENREPVPEYKALLDARANLQEKLRDMDYANGIENAFNSRYNELRSGRYDEQLRGMGRELVEMAHRREMDAAETAKPDQNLAAQYARALVDVQKRKFLAYSREKLLAQDDYKQGKKSLNEALDTLGKEFESKRAEKLQKLQREPAFRRTVKKLELLHGEHFLKFRVEGNERQNAWYTYIERMTDRIYQAEAAQDKQRALLGSHQGAANYTAAAQDKQRSQPGTADYTAAKDVTGAYLADNAEAIKAARARYAAQNKAADVRNVWKEEQKKQKLREQFAAEEEAKKAADAKKADETKKKAGPGMK